MLYSIILTYIYTIGFRLVNEKAMSIVKQWRRIKHANIVAIREAFTTRAFGDSCKRTDTKIYFFFANVCILTI